MFTDWRYHMPEFLTYAEAGRRLPVPKSEDCIRRWATVGLRGVRLATTWVGGSPRVTPEALAEFVERQTAARRSK